MYQVNDIHFITASSNIMFFCLTDYILWSPWIHLMVLWNHIHYAVNHAKDKLGRHWQKQPCHTSRQYFYHFPWQRENPHSNFPLAGLTSQKGIRDFLKIQSS
jgi:hypothetical protein